MPRRKKAHLSRNGDEKRGEESKETAKGCPLPQQDEGPAAKVKAPKISDREQTSERSVRYSPPMTRWRAAKLKGHISKLPDEVLLTVFSHLDSFLDRLRVAKVNKRLRKCIFKAMKTTQPLKLDFEKDQFCGDKLPKSKWPAVLQVLVKEAKFNQIEIAYRPTYAAPTPDIIRPFLSAPDCLTHVTSINVSKHFIHPDFPCLDSVIAKCEKLSVLKLSMGIKLGSPPATNPSPRSGYHSDEDEDDYVPIPTPALDLVSSLRDKPITELELELETCTQEQVLDLLHSMQPNVLQKLRLRFGYECDQVLDLVQFVRALCHTSAESIQVIEFLNLNPEDEGRTIRCSLGQLFSCIPDLPSLRRLFLYSAQGQGQFLPAVKSLLSNHSRTTPLVVEYENLDCPLYTLTRCELQSLMHRLVQDLPETVYGLDMENHWYYWKWKISLGNVSLIFRICGTEACNNPNCHQCRSFLPVVIHNLIESAYRPVSRHLDNYWLDRCKIEHVVEYPSFAMKALHAEENAAQNTATITYKWGNDIRFKITVATGQCSDRSCIRCLPIN